MAGIWTPVLAAVGAAEVVDGVPVAVATAVDDVDDSGTSNSPEPEEPTDYS